MNIKKKLIEWMPEGFRVEFISRKIASRCNHDSVTQIARRYLEDIKLGQMELISLKPKKDLVGQKIVWQYWNTSWEDAFNRHEIVSLCCSFIDRYVGGYRVIRLTDSTIGEYLDIPEAVRDRYHHYQDKGFRVQYFADTLRMALLATYGGVWLDATILMTGALPEKYVSLPFFAFQRDNQEPERAKWLFRTITYFGWSRKFKVRLLNSILSAEPKHIIPWTLYTLMVKYSEDYDVYLEYFLQQMFFQALVDDPDYSHYNCPIVSDCIPHRMYFDVVVDREQTFSIREAVALTSLHKMTYIADNDLEYLKQRLETLSSEC